MVAKTYTPAYSPWRTPSERALRAETLLSRYPKLSEPELAALIAAIPYLSVRDYALMTADSGLAEKLIAFERDHGRKRRTPLNSLSGLIALGVIAVAGALSWALA